MRPLDAVRGVLDTPLKPHPKNQDRNEIRRRNVDPKKARLREPGEVYEMAEREGFEPSIEFLTLYSLSRRAPSADSAISPEICLWATVGGGGSRIRTHGALTLNGFQDRRLKPLGHPSFSSPCGANPINTLMAPGQSFFGFGCHFASRERDAAIWDAEFGSLPPDWHLTLDLVC